MQNNNYTVIICPECGTEIEVRNEVLFYGIPFYCDECKATLKTK